MQKQEHPKIVIVGAGLSGLTAAQEILKELPNCDVTVLQAMDQVGGRTRSVKINNAIFDLGAQWIGPPQKYAIDLANRSQNQFINQFHTGTKILEFKKKIHRYTSDIPRGVGILQLIHLQCILWKLDRLAKKVPRQNPIQCPQSTYWDSITVYTWIQQNVWFQDIKKLVEGTVRAVIGCETNQVSFLFLLWYINQNHGVECLVNIDNGLQEKKLKYGTQHLSLYLEKQVQKKGCRVLLNRFVSKIKQEDNFCIIETRNDEKFQADYVIFAAPPPSANKIEFSPQLSRQRRLICNRYCMGAYSKMILLYQKQYWKEKGFSGEIFSDCENAPVFMTYDDSRTKDDGTLQPGIVVFFAGGIDQEWTNDQQQCMRAVTQQLASYFSIPELLAPIDYMLKVWNHEQSLGGAPTGYLPPGVLSKIHDIKKPDGRIHWAGTQLANVSSGYMDGAIESGIRVSKQIIRRVKNDKQYQKQLQKTAQPSSSWYKNIITASKKWFE